MDFASLKVARKVLFLECSSEGYAIDFGQVTSTISCLFRG